MNAESGQYAKIQYTQTPLGATTSQGQTVPGGLDLTTPSLRLQPGALMECVNFEVASTGGYSRVDGYERFDGRTSPSSVTFTVVQMAGSSSVDFDPIDFDSDFGSLPGFITTPTVGQVLVQVATGATGTVIGVVSTPTPYVVLAAVTGVFDHVSLLTVTPSGVAIGYATALTVAITALDRAVYTAAAANVYRALIGKVPGYGPVLGVVAMAFAGVDHVYAFRGDLGAVNALLYRATTAGWVLVPYLYSVSFTAGAVIIPLDGETLTQGGVTATVRRVMWTGGGWAGDAVGQFVIVAPTGGNFAAGAATLSGGATVTLSGVQTAITMAANGRFVFEKANFSGQAVTRRIYGCDGVNPPFEFDGVTLAPIVTGLSPNRPSIIKFHKNLLFVAQDASLLFSGPGTPFQWGAISGGGEIATGDTITGMITLPGSQTTATLGVFLRSSTAFLYGTDQSTFNFVTFASSVGAVPYSMQNLFDTFYLDDLGVVTLKTTLNYGNFLPTTLTKNILPFIASERGNLIASAINRSKGQYRLFFSDGYALYCTVLNQQYIGAAPQLFPDVFSGGIDTTKLVTDDEATYAGGASGYVFQLDVGTSFDGADIAAYFVTAWDPIKSPRVLKRFRASSIEVQGGNYAQIRYGYQLGYGSAQLAQLPAVPLTLNLANAPRWDSGFVWDTFAWDGSGLSPTDIDETGTAENVRVSVACGTSYIASFTVNSVIHHYSMRRGMRV